MFNASSARCAPIFCRIVDTLRLDEPYARNGVLYPTKVDLGDGISEMPVRELQDLLDRMFARSSRFATVRSGFVYDKHKKVVTTVRAYEQYIVTGNMRGGYIKGDPRFGPRLTGCSGATIKPGLKWNGEDL